MQRFELVKRVEERRKELNISIENLAKLSHIGTRTLNRFLANEDVKLSTAESVTAVLGLDLAGNQTICKDELLKQRAIQKATFIISLVQATSTLEKQGLENSVVEKMISDFTQEFLTGQYKKNLWVI